MEQKHKYLTDEDQKNIEGLMSPHRYFDLSLARTAFGLPPSASLYHYTTGDNLIKIVEKEELWATHISCLNDTTEFAYAVERFHERVKAKLSAPHDSKIDPLLRRFDEMLSNPGTETAPVFVACFSEQEDDISQWRAYSGGEGGYALQFDFFRLHQNGAGVLLVRVEYDPKNHARIFDDIIRGSEQCFLDCEGATKAPNPEAWADEFLTCWLYNFALFAPCLKHPKFKDEKEWRLIYYLHPDDPKEMKEMKFRQRQSMMSRHIPIPLLKPLPIKGVLVGPCRHPTLSRVAVGDLLQKAGYDPNIMKVEITEVPYRAV